MLAAYLVPTFGNRPVDQRYGELAELRRKDIDVKRRLIRVRRAVVFLKGGPVVGPPKSDAGVRDVSIPPHIWPVVEEHLAQYVRPWPDALLFPSEGRGHIWHRGMNNYFSKARTSAGREDLTWHDLRHTGETLAPLTRPSFRHVQRRGWRPQFLHLVSGVMNTPA